MSEYRRTLSLPPDFCEISKLDYAAEPDAFVLCLHVDPHRKLVEVEDSEQCGDRWKNGRTRLLYDSVHAFDQGLLEKFRRDLFPTYRGKPTSFTVQLNGVLKELGIGGNE